MTRKKKFQESEKREGFPIFSLPDKALKELLDEMDSLTLLELSLLSKRCLKAIQDCSIKGAWLYFEPNCIRLTAHKRDQLQIQFKEAKPNDSSSRIINGVNAKNWSVIYRDDRWREIIVKCSLEKGLEDACQIYNYLNNLFEIGHLMYEVEKKLDEFYKKTMKKLPRTVESVIIGRLREKGNERKVSRMIRYFNIENCLNIRCHMRRLPEELTCKKLSLCSHSLTNEDIITFIQKWLNNETQLEELRVSYENSDHDLNAYLIMEGFNTKKWDRKKRSRDYYDINCAEFLDIERESDGALASLGYDPDEKELIFFDWKNWQKELEEEQTFPLYSLPHLALKLVLETMETVDVFEVSLLSKRSKAYIKSCSIPMKTLTFSSHSLRIGEFDAPFTELELFFYSNNNRKSTSSRIIKNCQYDMWSKGNPERFREHVIHCTPSHPDGNTIVVQHLHDLFRYENIKYYCETRDHLFINQKMRKLPRNATHLEIGDRYYQDVPIEDQIETILDYCDAANALELSSVVSTFSERVRNINCLAIVFAQEIPFETLLTLNCKSIRIWNHKLTNENVITWIQKWQKGNTRLKSLYIRIQELDFKVLQKGLNGEVRSREVRGDYYRSNEYIVLKNDQDGSQATLNEGDRFFDFNVLA